MYIRKVQVSDDIATAALLNSIIEARDFTAMDRVYSVEEQRDYLSLLPERGAFWVAFDDAGQLLGMQDVTPAPSHDPEATRHIGDISTFVAFEAQRKGVGKALFAYTLRAVQEQGFTKLCAWVRGDNPNAQRFYSSLGFRVVGRARNHIRVRGEYRDQVFLEKLLGV